MVITQAKGHIRPDSVKISLTRRAAFAGVALLAAPSTALAVCVAPDGTHPIDELLDEAPRASAAIGSGVGELQNRIKSVARLGRFRPRVRSQI